jgi:hypothetical protein
LIVVRYGALFGFKGVTDIHYQNIEYLKRMKELGERLYNAANDPNNVMNIPFVLGIID